MDPLLDIFLVFLPFSLNLTDLFQHRLLGHFQNLIKDLFIGSFRHGHHFGHQIFFPQLLSHYQQRFTMSFLYEKRDRQIANYNHNPDQSDKGNGLAGGPGGDQK